MKKITCAIFAMSVFLSSFAIAQVQVIVPAPHPVIVVAPQPQPVIVIDPRPQQVVVVSPRSEPVVVEKRKHGRGKGRKH